MYSATSMSKRLVLVPIMVVVATQLLLMCSGSPTNSSNASYVGHKCYAKYKQRIDKKNINRIVLSYLKAKDPFPRFQEGWGKMSLPNAYLMFQCRGEMFWADCQSCFTTAQEELGKICPGDHGGIILYDQCIVEYSPLDTSGKVNYDDGLCLSSTKKVPDGLSLEAVSLLKLLTDVAISSEKMKGFGVGEITFQQKRTIQATVQCNRELSDKDCVACVSHNIAHYKNCYGNKEGARVFMGKSCNFRFELYPFMNPKACKHYYKF